MVSFFTSLSTEVREILVALHFVFSRPLEHLARSGGGESYRSIRLCQLRALRFFSPRFSGLLTSPSHQFPRHHRVITPAQFCTAKHYRSKLTNSFTNIRKPHIGDPDASPRQTQEGFNKRPCGFVAVQAPRPEQSRGKVNQRDEV